MAKPQLENGHTQIANELLEHLVQIHLSPNQWQVLLCIIRKTYGFHKKVDYIANSQIVEATGLCKAVVSRSLKKLEEMMLIIRNGKSIGFQKDWEQWQKFAKQSTIEKLAISTSELAISTSELAKQSTKVSSPAVAQKIKDTYTKETIQKKGEKDNLILPEWLNLKAWDGFLTMRAAIKKKPTPLAKELLLSKLTSLREEGYDHIEVLNQSIMGNYQGLFPVNKEKGSGENRRGTQEDTEKSYTQKLKDSAGRAIRPRG